MLTVRYAQAVPTVTSDSVDPGLLAADLHGTTTAESPAAGADVVARLATIGKDGPTGRFHDKDGQLPWDARLGGRPSTDRSHSRR